MPPPQIPIMARSLEDFFGELPVVTKFYLCAAFLSTLGVMLKIINPMYLILDFDLIWSKFQVSLPSATLCATGTPLMPLRLRRSGAS